MRRGDTHLEEFISPWLSRRLWEQQKGGRKSEGGKFVYRTGYFGFFHDVIVYV